MDETRETATVGTAVWRASASSWAFLDLSAD